MSDPESDSLRIAVISHLSKEIEAHITTVIKWRTSSAFTTLIGPFFLLGAVIVSDKITISPFKWGDYNLQIVVLSGCYLALGSVAALIERYSWRRINLLRAELLKLGLDESPVEHQKITLRLHDSVENWKNAPLGYLVTFLAIILATGIVIFLISNILQSAG